MNPWRGKIMHLQMIAGNGGRRAQVFRSPRESWQGRTRPRAWLATEGQVHPRLRTADVGVSGRGALPGGVARWR
jgi:hypothetical protein